MVKQAIFFGFLILVMNGQAVKAMSLTDILNADHRSTLHKARDQYRHPEATLDFFAVTNTMTVVEISPGSEGWYTEILAPFLRDKGKLYAAHFSSQSKVPFFRNSLKKFKQKIKPAPKVYDKLVLTELDPPQLLDIAPEGSADRVLTFRNVHNWQQAGQADAVFKAMFKALKSGGILGVVEHRGPADLVEKDTQAKSGYMTERAVIALAERAGFKLQEKSEINTNLKDTADHPQGVWTLPPSLKLKEVDQEKYLTIGESDRMTLKFVKP